jgi:UDP-glucose-4-epimerase GalE
MEPRTDHNILVTGGEGYIGAHTVRALVERGFRVVIVDWHDNGVADASRGTELVLGDVSDPRLLADLMAEHRFDAVIHLAALKSVEESFERPGDYFRVNAMGTLAIADALAAAAGGRPPAPVVYSSTCAIYGEPDRVPVAESSPARPANPYASSKLMGEQILSSYSAARGLRSMSLRYFNAAGASTGGLMGEDPARAQSLIPRVMEAAMGVRDELVIYGTDYATDDGTAVRDYVHVDDLAAAHVLALDHLLAGGRTNVVNLGSGRGVSVGEVIAATERVTGRSIPVRHASRRTGDTSAIWADISLAADLLRWSPARSFEEIIATAWLWHSGRDRRVVAAGS